MKKNKPFAFLFCIIAAVCTSFFVSCDDKDDKNFVPSEIIGSWKIYDAREISYDKDGNVVDESTIVNNSYYHIWTFKDRTLQDDRWLDMNGGHGDPKFEVDISRLYNITFLENSLIIDNLIETDPFEQVRSDKTLMGEKFDYSINGDFLTATSEHSRYFEKGAEIEGAVKGEYIVTFKKVDDKKLSIQKAGHTSCSAFSVQNSRTNFCLRCGSFSSPPQTTQGEIADILSNFS